MFALIIDEEIFNKIVKFGKTRSIADATEILDQLNEIIKDGSISQCHLDSL